MSVACLLGTVPLAIIGERGVTSVDLGQWQIAAFAPGFLVSGWWLTQRRPRLAIGWIFIAAGVTDYLDGYYARIWDQQSAFGRMLDPIADKLLVASCLLILAADNSIHGWTLWAGIVILCREILVSGLREYLAALRVSVPVTRLAKWKTTVQLVAIGFLIAGEAGEQVLPATTMIGIVLLWMSAIFTIYTGWDYFRHGIHHLIKEDEE